MAVSITHDHLFEFMLLLGSLFTLFLAFGLAILLRVELLFEGLLILLEEVIKFVLFAVTFATLFPLFLFLLPDNLLVLFVLERFATHLNLLLFLTQEFLFAPLQQRLDSRLSIKFASLCLGAGIFTCFFDAVRVLQRLYPLLNPLLLAASNRPV